MPDSTDLALFLSLLSMHPYRFVLICRQERQSGSLKRQIKQSDNQIPNREDARSRHPGAQSKVLLKSGSERSALLAAARNTSVDLYVGGGEQQGCCSGVRTGGMTRMCARVCVASRVWCGVVWCRTVDGAELPLVSAGEDFLVQSFGLLELALLQIAGCLERRGKDAGSQPDIASERSVVCFCCRRGRLPMKNY